MPPRTAPSRSSTSRPDGGRRPSRISASLAVDAAGRLALADYYMGVGRNTDAMKLLTELQQSAEKPDAREARLRIASIEYGAGRKAEAHRHLDELIKERPRFAAARTAKARMLLTDGAPPAEAVAQAREAVKARSVSRRRAVHAWVSPPSRTANWTRRRRRSRRRPS